MPVQGLHLSSIFHSSPSCLNLVKSSTNRRGNSLWRNCWGSGRNSIGSTNNWEAITDRNLSLGLISTNTLANCAWERLNIYKRGRVLYNLLVNCCGSFWKYLLTRRSHHLIRLAWSRSTNTKWITLRIWRLLLILIMTVTLWIFLNLLWRLLRLGHFMMRRWHSWLIYLSNASSLTSW